MGPDKVDWLTGDSNIANYFTVKDALWLPQWNRLARLEDGLGPDQKQNLCNLFNKMDTVRVFFNKPIIVHVTFRPKSYNALVKGAPNSAHMYGMAIDFHVKDVDCDDARAKIVPMLETWGMRCENLKGASWVHLDTRDVPAGGNRFFIP